MVRMRAGSAVMMAVFTVGWSAAAWGGGKPGLFQLGILLALYGVALIVAVVLVGRQVGRVTAISPEASSDPAVREATRVFRVGLTVEGVAIVVAATVVSQINTNLTMSTVALIVGLHFAIFWIAPATRHIMHLVTTVIGAGAGAAGIASISAGADPGVAQGWVGVAMAVITAFYGTVFIRWMRQQR